MIIFSNENASADHSLYAAAIRVAADHSLYIAKAITRIAATYSEWSVARRIAAVCIPHKWHPRPTFFTETTTP